MSGRLISIHLAPGPAEPMVSVPEVRAVESMGLEGDRYYRRTGTFARNWKPDAEVTLIEAEAIEALARDYRVSRRPRTTRRNLVTRGVALNHLVGQWLRIGEVTFPRPRPVRALWPSREGHRARGRKYPDPPRRAPGADRHGWSSSVGDPVVVED